MTPRKGDRVRVTAQWSSFFGMAGTVTATAPVLMMRIDGDSYDIRVGAREVTVETAEPHHGGAE